MSTKNHSRYGLQNFYDVRDGQGDCVAKAAEIIQDRQAPTDMIAWFSNRALHKKNAPKDFQNTSGMSRRVVCRASCHESCCFKILSVSTIIRCMRGKDRADPLQCPCCQLSGTYSPLHVIFKDAISDWYKGPIVWEWGDCPQHGNKMHWDAALRVGAEVFRFEIDGSYHSRPTTRANDRKKNELVVAQRVPLLRMHDDDNATWGPMAQAFVRDATEGVYYTQSYERYRDQSLQEYHLVKYNPVLGAHTVYMDG